MPHFTFEIPRRTGHKPNEMIWFRTKLKHCAALALMALALNFALAFGHCHLDGGRGHLAVASLLGSSGSEGGTVPVNTNGDDDGCAICRAVAAIGTAVASTPPALPVALSYARLARGPANELVVRQSTRADVRVRGPPPLTLQT
jgi:hypothetical protein